MLFSFQVEKHIVLSTKQLLNTKSLAKNSEAKESKKDSLALPGKTWLSHEDI